MPSFQVEDSVFELPDSSLSVADEPFVVRSSPRNYAVDYLPSISSTADAVLDERSRHQHAPLVGDRRVLDLHFGGEGPGVPFLGLEATEDLKSLDGVMQVLDFLVDSRVGRHSMVFVVGGGIIQDVVGMATGILQRGVPWTYVPTTLLSQADSCIGSKTGVNYGKTKNLLGLFHAPHRVLVHSGFVRTLRSEDILSGLGEIFKLSITGGRECLSTFESHIDDALAGDPAILCALAALALRVKRPVIEADEFDIDVRRALNFGHSVGHALESATEYAVAHGIAVTVGALIESEVSRQRGRLSNREFDRLLATGEALVPRELKSLLAGIDIDVLSVALGRDKKVEGQVLKLAVPVEIGRIEFLDLPLGVAPNSELGGAIKAVTARL